MTLSVLPPSNPEKMAIPLHQADLESYLQTLFPQEKALRQLFPKNAHLTIFDIGACEGEDSIRYARCFPNAKIFSFEPLIANHLLIKTNLDLFKINSVELIPAALSHSVGTSIFHLSSGSPKENFCGDQWNYGNKSSPLLPPKHSEPMYGWIEFKDTVEVPTETLAHFCESRGIKSIDFIHMDVQGAELLVLQGAEKKIKNISTIWLEVSNEAHYKNQPLRPQVMSFMAKHGFILAFESLRENEGDQFYVNRRHVSFWPWLLQQKARQLTQHIRSILGAGRSRLKRRVTEPFSSPQ